MAADADKPFRGVLGVTGSARLHSTLGRCSMKWYRRIAFVWCILGAIGLVWLAYQFLKTGHHSGDAPLFWFGGFSAMALLGAASLSRVRTWARWLYLVLSSVLLFFCSLFVIFAHYDGLVYIIWCGFLLFSVCSLAVLLFVRRYETQTQQG